MLWNPVLINCHGGIDTWAWDENTNLEFFFKAKNIKNNIPLNDDGENRLVFETHRSRCLFNPWTTRVNKKNILIFFNKILIY